MSFFKGAYRLRSSISISSTTKYLHSKIYSAKTLIESLVHEIASKGSDGEIVQQSPIWIRATVISLMGSTIFGIGWLCLAKTDEVVTVSGQLEPLGSVQEIQMPLGGIASEILVDEGDEVTVGQVVMRLDAETSKQRRTSLLESQKLKRIQLELKESELDKYLMLNDEETNILKQNIKIQGEILNRFYYLKTIGATSEIQYLQQLDRVSELEGKLKQAKLDRLRQQAIQNQEIQQIKAALEDLQSKITEASVNLRYQALRSPVDGIVFDLQPRGEGYVARGTETVMKIVPYDTLQANVEIPSNQIGFVKVGMPADLNIDSFPSTDFGVLHGTVKSIGSDALPPDQIKNRPEYRYPAVISLSSQKLKLKDGKELGLQVGMSLSSNIKLRKVSYLQLLLGSFQDKVDSLREL